MINEALQNSISKNVLTALVLVTPESDPSGNSKIDNRLFVIEQLAPGSSNWTQISTWESLPDGVIVNPATSNFITSNPNVANSPSALSYQGQIITPTAYQIFLPDVACVPETIRLGG